MSEIIIKDESIDILRLRIQNGRWQLDTVYRTLIFDDPVELKLLAEFILENLEEKP